LKRQKLINIFTIEPGQIGFAKRVNLVKETSATFPLEMIRTGGTDGEIEVKWRTIVGKIQPPDDFKSFGGSLKFSNGEVGV